MNTIRQIECSKDDAGDVTLKFVYTDNEATPYFIITIPMQDRDAFFNMVSQIHQTYMHADSNPYVTMRDFVVTLPVETQMQGRQKLKPLQERRMLGNG